MNQEEKEIALTTLNYLCLGGKIEGLMFYGLRILLSESDTNSKRINGQISINIESNFHIFESMTQVSQLTNERVPFDWTLPRSFVN